MDLLLTALKAAGEATRLRLLALCAHGELTVSEMTQILGQSQPRVSRHLKLLCEAGLLERFREGSWAFFRLAERTEAAALARAMVDAIPADDITLALDLERLEAIKRHRAERATTYFRENAPLWHDIRSRYVPEREVEEALRELIAQQRVSDLLDIGTGTGRMLEILGPHVERALGIDYSREMLAIARTNLEAAGLRHCQVRQGDMYQLPVPSASFDAVTIHMVLHYAEDPADVIAEAARVLRPGGRLVLVDFAPHELDYLRDEHQHRRLGFADDEIQHWLRLADLSAGPLVRLPGEPLTVTIWQAYRPAAASTKPIPNAPSTETRQ